MELRKCPFCKQKLERNWATLHYNEVAKKWMLQHHCCDGVVLMITGATEEEVIQKWNGKYEK